MRYNPSPGAGGGGGGGAGPAGRGIVSVDWVLASGDHSPGTTDLYTVTTTYTDASTDTDTIPVYNGMDGAGGGGGGGSSLVVNARTASYSLQASDAGKFVTLNVAPPTVATLTIPTGLPGSLAAPMEVLVGRRGEGSVLIAAAVGVTLIPNDTRRSLAVVGSQASLIHQGGDVWWITGALV